MSEIDYFKNRTNCTPKVYISYSRVAYFSKTDSNFRITFDTDIITRRHDLRFESGSYGVPMPTLAENNLILMEMKINGAIPMWCAKALSEINIFPTGYSKYGEEYKLYLTNKVNYNDEDQYYRSTEVV
jgi:hypothetical protein